MQRRDDRHAQPVEQRENVVAGFAAENAELVLERDNVVLAVVQNICRASVVLDRLVADFKPDLCRIIVRPAVVGHRDDAGFNVGIQGCDSLSEIGREGRDAAAAWQGVSDESNALELAHVRTSGGRRCGRCDIAENAAAGGEATPLIRDRVPQVGRSIVVSGTPRLVCDQGLCAGGAGLQGRHFLISRKTASPANVFTSPIRAWPLRRSSQVSCGGPDNPLRARRSIDLLKDEVGGGDEKRSSRSQSLREGTSRRHPGIGDRDGLLNMQIPGPSIVEQTEGRVATLLDLGDHETGPDGVD